MTQTIGYMRRYHIGDRVGGFILLWRGECAGNSITHVKVKCALCGTVYERWANLTKLSETTGCAHCVPKIEAERIEGRTIKEWADEYGVAVSSMYKRVKRHGTVRPQLKLIRWRRWERTLTEWALLCGMSRQAVFERMKRGGPPVRDHEADMVIAKLKGAP